MNVKETYCFSTHEVRQSRMVMARQSGWLAVLSVLSCQPRIPQMFEALCICHLRNYNKNTLKMCMQALSTHICFGTLDSHNFERTWYQIPKVLW